MTNDPIIAWSGWRPATDRKGPPHAYMTHDVSCGWMNTIEARDNNPVPRGKVSQMKATAAGRTPKRCSKCGGGW